MLEKGGSVACFDKRWTRVLKRQRIHDKTERVKDGRANHYHYCTLQGAYLSKASPAGIFVTLSNLHELAPRTRNQMIVHQSRQPLALYRN